jgi:hypothetical protein
MGEELLRSKYPFEEGGESSDDELGVDGFLWGAVDPPEVWSLGGNFRALQMRRKVEGASAEDHFYWMQADFEAALQVDQFIASASVGYAPDGALGAVMTRDPENNWVSRQHWAGFWLGDWGLVRAGRMNLPFGIRTIEHTLWARAFTRTDINDDQQHGVAFAYQKEPIRAEIMAVLGNFQLRPDEFRERGYSAYVEYFPLAQLSVGASSLLLHSELDQRTLRETWRHAYGAFSRWGTPWKPLVVLTEWDYALDSTKQDQRREGLVGFVQADIEAAQGVHLILTGEANNVGINSPDASYGGWVSYQWFFAPHADLRFDGIFQSLGGRLYRTGAQALLMQLHVYL